MAIEAELFDGTVLEFPDGTSQDVINRVAKAQTAQRRQGAASPTGASSARPGAPRIIDFEGRSLEVPADATDDEVRWILSGAQGQAPATGAPRSQQPATEPWAAFPDAPPRATMLTPPQDAAAEGRNLPTPSVAPAAAPSDDRGLIGTIMSTVDMAGRGIANGAANMAGLPQSLMELQRQGAGWAMRKVGVPDEIHNAVMKHGFPLADILPSADGMKRALNRANDVTADAIGMPRPSTTPQNVAETIVNRIGEEVGAMALPTAGILAKAAGTTAQAAREGGRLSRMFIEPAVVNPSRFVRREATLAAGAGTGAGVANTLIDRETGAGQVADIVGAIMGAGATGLASATGRGFGSLAQAVTNRGGYVDDVVRDAVADRIAEASGLQRNAGRPVDTQELVDIISGKPSIGEAVPGVVESLADRAGNAGIASLEYSRQSGPNAGMFAQRRTDNEQAIARAIGANEPNGYPAALRNELDSRRTSELTSAAAARAAAQAEVETATQRIAPTTPYAEDRGAAVRAGLENAERAARDTERAAWQGISGQVDPAPLAHGLEATRDGMPVARQQLVSDLEPAIGIPRQFAEPAAPRPSAILGPDGNPVMSAPTAAEMPLEELTALRSSLTTAQRNALRGPQPDRNRAEAIGGFINQIDSFLAGSLPEETLTQAALARGVSRDVNERFNRPNDPIAAVLSRREGRPDVPDSGVARRFVQPDAGQGSNIDRLLAETDLSSQARNVRSGVRDEILADIQKRGLAGKPEELERYLSDYSRVFDRFPDLREELTQVGGAARGALDAVAAESTLQRELGTVDRRGTGTVGKYLAYGDAQSDKAIREVMASRDPVRSADELLAYAGGKPEAVQGARQAFWNVMRDEATPSGHTTKNIDGHQPWNPTKLKTFLDDPTNRAVAQRLWQDDPQHIDNVRKIAEVTQRLDTRNAGKARNTSGTPQSMLPSAETLGSRMFAYKRGQVGGAYLIGSMAAVIGRRAVRGAQASSIERVLDDALLNPEIATMLLKENNSANRAALRRSAKTWFGNEATSIINAMSGDDGETDPVKRAAMR